MAAQVQCPNCGGYHVSGYKENKKFYEQHKRPAALTWIDWLVAVGTLVLGILAVLLGQSILDETNYTSQLGSILVGVGVLVSFVGVLFFIGCYRVIKKGSVTERRQIGNKLIYHYTCDLCNYKWTRS